MKEERIILFFKPGEEKKKHTHTHTHTFFCVLLADYYQTES